MHFLSEALDATVPCQPGRFGLVSEQVIEEINVTGWQGIGYVAQSRAVEWRGEMRLKQHCRARCTNSENVMNGQTRNCKWASFHPGVRRAYTKVSRPISNS